MSSNASSRTATRVVLATFATQAVVTMSNSTLPTIAPKLAEALGMEAALIGYQVSILFGGAVIGTLFGGSYTRRYGACRTMQTSLTLSANGGADDDRSECLFGGVLIGPSLFAAAFGVTGSYSDTFVLVAVAAVAGGALVALARQAASTVRRAA